MCRYSVLAHNATGYFIQCKDCGHFRLAFGTTEMMIDESEVNTFYENLASGAASANDRIEANRKTIRIRISDSKIAIALTPNEAKDLIAIIDEARATLAVQHLLDA